MESLKPENTIFLRRPDRKDLSYVPARPEL